MSPNNKQLSLMISFFILALFVLTLFNIRLQGKQEDEIRYEMVYEEEIPEEFKEELKPDLAELETHEAYNEAEKEVKSRFNDELEEFKTLEELQQEQQEAKGEDSPDELNDLSLNSATAKYKEKLKEQRQKMAELNKKSSEDKDVNIKRKTTISYSLIGRSKRIIPNPVYTCDSFGKVVINIKVDSYGNVVEATYNKSSSTTSNGCLIDNAINYALQAKFNKDLQKPDQLGTITYQFQGE
ncbi:hypothetical protein [Zhouia amylolytica]|uniref:TonB family protein n=2 Tax=Zhouia amylolytica TaxID=376730 RepID=W2UML2_9FLAO|nr:hypothetical protein [Zhouia amylolytica]ETN94587.1 hypothetical protein P278_25300 [Zhouia amylolytica AD3]